jgi:hypothetical protein
MRLILIASLFASTTILSSGCVLQTQERSQASERSRSGKDDRCRPNQDWDAKQQKCVHRGKGKGARKHDD